MKAVIVLAAMLAVASAARIPDDIRLIWAPKSDAAQLARRPDYTEKTTRIKFTYFVDPHRMMEFVDEWRKLEDKVSDEKAVRIYDLKKSTGDNIMFVGYGEWDSFDDWMRHSEQDYVQDFMEWCGEHEVHYRWEPLIKAADEDVKPSKGDRVRDRDMAHVLIKYHVPGALHKEFIDTWQGVQERTCKEKRNRIYSLRKSALDNEVFYTYGTWDDMESYLEHLQSRHVRDLLEYTADKDITWFMQPFFKVGSQPE